VGGGRDLAPTAEVFRPFVSEALARSRGADPVIVLLLVLEPDDVVGEQRFTALVVAAGAPVDAVRVARVTEGAVFAPSVLAGAHGVVVGGGLTPAYLDAMMPLAAHLRRAVAEGMPYLGFSAGAAIAPARALVGGHRLGGVPVSPEDAAEELDELTVRPGLGLVDFGVDVHAAQWGTVARLVAAVDAGLLESGVAIDEYTALCGSRVHGAGRVWRAAAAADGGVAVTLRKP
jgi:cyanophycinase